MALHSRFADPPAVLLVAALLVSIPSLVVQVGGAVGAALAACVTLLAAGLLAWRLRLASPAVVSVGVVLVSAVSAETAPVVLAALPVVAGVAALEYAVRRLAGRAPTRLSSDTEAALVAGAVTGVTWTGAVHAVLPASDDFGVLVRDVGPGGFVDPVASLVSVVAGPVLVVGLAVALVARFRLATPLLFAGLEVGSFLAGPNSGDSVGSLASLLWILGVPLLLAVAAVELWLRTEGLPAVRARASGS